MFGFHIWELLIILLIVILLFGARRLPELGSSMGKSIHLFRKNMNDTETPALEGEKMRESVKVRETVTVRESDD